MKYIDSDGMEFSDVWRQKVKKISSKLLIVIIYLLCVSNPIFSSENSIDSMCGIWVDNEKVNYSVSIEKIDEDEYFVVYSETPDNHKFDFSKVCKVIEDNLIECYIEEDNINYIYFDFEYDSIYILWNHKTPNPYYNETELKRVNYYFNKEIVKQRELEIG